MPQFDTFSFFSQLFWVFCLFSFFYLSLAYFILPALAVTLKVRKRKMAANSTYSSSSSSDISAERPNLYLLNELSTSSDIYEGSSIQTNKDSILRNIVLKNEIIQNFSFKKLYKNTALLAVFF